MPGLSGVERGGDLLVLDFRWGRLLGGERLGEQGLAFGAERERDPLAAPLLVHVPEDLVEPRAAVRAALEPAERLPGLEEDLRREVLGLGRPARQAQRRARDLPEVRPRFAVEVLAHAGLGVGGARTEEGHADEGLRV